VADVPVIQPDGVYSPVAAAQLLGFKPNTLPRYMKRGELRYSMRGGRRLILGRWLLEFLEAGEVRKRSALDTSPAKAA
jgi:predicted site-specific integrase-resolvase